MAQLIILLLIFVLPFIVGTLGLSFFETPKIYVAQFLIEILLLITLFKSDFTKKFALSPITILLFSIFFFSILQMLFYPSPFAFFGNEFRKQGAFLLWHLLVFAFIVSLSKPVLFKPPYNLVQKYLPHCVLLLLFISTFLFGTSPDERAVGVFGEPNSLGVYAAFLWPLTGSLLFAPISFAIILLSGSRSAFIAFGIQIAFIFLTKKLHLSTLKSSLICILLIVCSLSLILLETSAEYQNRPLIWNTAYHAGMEYPAFGRGFGDIETGLKLAAQELENPLRFEYVDSSHNMLLDWWVQGGIVGVILIIVLVGLTLKNLTSQYEAAVSDSRTLGKLRNQDIRQFENRSVRSLVYWLSDVSDISGAQSILSFLSLLTGLLFNPVSVAILVPFWWLVGRSQSSTSK
jgi:hypothetical protein